MNAKQFRKLMLIGLSAFVVQTATAKNNFLLGFGFQPATGEYIPISCLKNGGTYAVDHTKWGNPQGELKFEQVQTVAELNKVLDVGGSLSVETVKFSGTAEGSYLNKITTSSKAINIIYALKVTSDAYLDLERLKNPDAKSLMFEQYSKNYNVEQLAEFTSQCGPGYIASSTAEASLVAVITITFDSQQSQEDFNAKIKATVDAGAAKVGVTGALKMANEDSKGGAKISFQAFQRGGDPLLMPHMLSTAIVDCGTGGKIAGALACDQVVKDVITYGQDFGKQLKKSDGTTDFGAYFYSVPNYLSYASLLGTPDSGVTLEAKNWLNTLVKKYDDLSGNVKLLSEYLSRLGEGYKDYSGYADASAYMNHLNTVLTKYKSDPNVADCLKKVSENSCKASYEAIAAAETPPAPPSTASKEVKKAAQLLNRESNMLSRIKNGNLQINLLTLQSSAGIDPTNGSPYPAKFRKMACGVIPLGSGTADLSVRVDCPNITDNGKLIYQSSRDLVLNQKFDSNYGSLQLGSGKSLTTFGYNIIDVDKKLQYCFYYKDGLNFTTALDEDGQPSLFGEYISDATIAFTTVSVDSKCPSQSDTGVLPVNTNQVGNGMIQGGSGADEVTASEQSLTRFYPNILGVRLEMK